MSAIGVGNGFKPIKDCERELLIYKADLCREQVNFSVNNLLAKATPSFHRLYVIGTGC